MRIDIRKEDTNLDAAVFADKADNYYSAKDSYMGDYATEVEFSGYGGVDCILFDQRSIKREDWKNVKKAIDAIFKAQKARS